MTQVDQSKSRFVVPARCLLFSVVLLAAGSPPAGAVDIMDVYRMALDSDPAIQGAGFDHQASREILDQARSGYLPAVFLRIASIDPLYVEASYN